MWNSAWCIFNYILWCNYFSKNCSLISLFKNVSYKVNFILEINWVLNNMINAGMIFSLTKTKCTRDIIITFSVCWIHFYCHKKITYSIILKWSLNLIESISFIAYSIPQTLWNLCSKSFEVITLSFYRKYFFFMNLIFIKFSYFYSMGYKIT